MSKKKYNKIFITGGAGYCGSRLIPELLKEEYKVVVYDTFYFGNFLPKKSKNLKIVKGDIRDSNKIYENSKGCDVFLNLGFSVDKIKEQLRTVVICNEVIAKPTLLGKKKIGFAPFAKHDAKMYSLDSFKEIISHFDDGKYELYLFGGRGAEDMVLDEWEKQFSHVIKKTGQTDLKTELETMKELDIMLTMDSANMHLASMVGVPVVSIWGATHPYAGFYGYNQNTLNAVQVNLSCRPCSVFGNRACWRGDHACMKEITPAMVIDKIEAVLSRL